MHMVSYAGRADMQILVAKDIIPDPEFLAKCFEDSLLEMKEAALTSKKTLKDNWFPKCGLNYTKWFIMMDFIYKYHSRCKISVYLISSHFYSPINNMQKLRP